jgi:Mrp family chromosome partitioning ATPase
LVARAHEVPGDVVRRARDRLNFVDAKILGVVLNGIDITSAEYAQFRQVYRSYYTNYAQLIEEPSANGSSLAGHVNGKVAGQVNGKIAQPQFVKSINVTLTDYIGPIASVIVSEKIAALGESPEDFPQSRIGELIDSVAHEILDSESRISFKERCSDCVAYST